jgi:hypothetical protein
VSAPITKSYRIKLLVIVALAALVFVYRQRIYLRIPIASVYRNQVRQTGVQVFVNYSFDVLLEKDDEPGAYRTLVQSWSRMPGTPTELQCLRWMVCLTDANHASTIPMFVSGNQVYDPQVTLTKHEVSFVDRDGATVRVVFYERK